MVLAARSATNLQTVAEACRALGSDAIAVTTDVTQEEDVARLLQAALAAHGRVDIWINNAGVTEFGFLDEGPFDKHRQVLETNTVGPMLAARVVIPQFLRQRSGILVNVGSILSKVGQPFVPSYVVSKFGLRGLSEALRVQLSDHPDIHVCTLLPYAIDTPHFERGANEVGREAYPMPPTQSTEKVARALVALVRRPRRELHVPRYAVLGFVFRWAFPRTAEQLLLHALAAWHFGEAPQRDPAGNVFQSTGQGHVHGTRAPRIGPVAFAWWTLKELGRIQLGALRAPASRWRAHAEPV